MARKKAGFPFRVFLFLVVCGCGVFLWMSGCDKLSSKFRSLVGYHAKSNKPTATSTVHHHTTSGPRLAILLDDLGSDRSAAEAIFSLPFPITISVLPFHEHSMEIAAEAERRGYEVMLHLPMQSVGNETPEAQELHSGMSREEVSRTLEAMLQSVPSAAGVNNHQGSQATADAQLMEELMPIFKQRGLFFVDSRTTAATLAFEAAEHAGVRSGFRNVPFLDDQRDEAAIRKQLELAVRGAKEKGTAIAIGHPHPETLRALKEVLPHIESQGVHLVFVSELVR